MNSGVWVLETNCEHLIVETLRAIHKFRAIMLQSLCILFFTFLLRLNRYLHGIKLMFWIMQRKTKKINYDACVISNLSNEYVHQYWIGPLTLTSNGKYMSRYSIKLKNNWENIISSLHIIWTIFISSLYVCCVCNLLEHISLKKWSVFMSASHIFFGNKSW